MRDLSKFNSNTIYIATLTTNEESLARSQLNAVPILYINKLPIFVISPQILFCEYLIVDVLGIVLLEKRKKIPTQLLFQATKCGCTEQNTQVQPALQRTLTLEEYVNGFENGYTWRRSMALTAKICSLRILCGRTQGKEREPGSRGRMSDDGEGWRGFRGV